MGVRNTMLIPYYKFEKEESLSELRAPHAVLLLPTKCDTLAEGVPEIEEFQVELFRDLRVIPDKSTYKIAPWNPNVGLVFSYH